MDESAVDINPFNIQGSNSSNKTISKIKFDPNETYYDMSGDKYLVIFNHYKFEKSRYFHYQRPSTRNGTEQDVESLKKLFGGLGFKVFIHNDLTHEKIVKVVGEISKQDHSNTSCLCVVILSHGDKDGDVFAADRPYQVRDLLVTLGKGDSTLASKPKLFFIQACRGDKIDDGVQIDSNNDAAFHIPSQADILVLYSAVEDYLSFRDANGSWMIQELCKVIKEHHNELDLLQMITLVHKRVAYERATYIPSNKSLNNKKQMPETRFTLTKFFKF